MKQYLICSLSSRNMLLTRDCDYRYGEYSFEQFTISASVLHRPCFDTLIGSTIQCSFNKTSRCLRYQNESLFSELLSKGAVTINHKKLEDSKIYTQEQKDKFIAIQPQPLDSSHLVDLSLSEERTRLRAFSKKQTVDARIECLSQKILVRFTGNGISYFLPIRLKNLTHFFQCLPQATYSHFLPEHRQLPITLHPMCYSLESRQIEIQASLPIAVELQILAEGWATVNPQSLLRLPSQESQKYLKTEELSMANHVGVFKHQSEILNMIYAKNGFVGVVSDILDGYNYEVTRKDTGQTIKLQLSLVICPVGDQAGAYDCAEFARKNLIGQAVHVYLMKDTGLNTMGTIIRSHDSKDIEMLLLENGWATVKEELADSMLTIRHNELQKKAKDKLKGLFNKGVGIKRFEDLTSLAAHKDPLHLYRRLQVLKQLVPQEEGILKEMYDPVTFSVLIDSRNLLIKVHLEEALAPGLNPLLPEAKEISKAIQDYFNKHARKREVFLTISDYEQETNTFLGTITLKQQSLQQLLVAQGLLYLSSRSVSDSLLAAEKAARGRQLHLWQSSLLQFEIRDPLDRLPKKFLGKISWVEDGQLIYVQPEQRYERLEEIWSRLNEKELSPIENKNDIVVGAVVAAPYFEAFYRAKILSYSSKANKYRIYFIDWGNRQLVQIGVLRQLPPELMMFEDQAIPVRLRMVAPIPRRIEALQSLRDELMDNGESGYSFEKVFGEYVDCFRGKEYINYSLIERGMSKSVHLVVPNELKQKLKAIEEKSRASHIGVWEQSEEEESDDEQLRFIEEGKLL